MMLLLSLSSLSAHGMIKDEKVEEGETLISYDVKALYPSVPQDETLALIHTELQNDPHLQDKTPMSPANFIKLFELCVKRTYFMFNGKLYQQINGLPMGAPTSVFAAEIFMIQLEKQAIATFIQPPSIWKRYVDDTFTKIQLQYKDAFLDHLNAQHSRIEFTSEGVEDNKIAFLDTEINIDSSGNLFFKIYRKPTHTSQYLNFQSNHHISQKLGIVSTFQHRIDTIITKEEDKTKEQQEVAKSLKRCGYPDWALKNNNKRTSQKKDDYLVTTSIPYVKSLSEKLARTYKRFRVRTVHKPTSKIRHQLCKVKDSIHDMDKVGAIYQVECQKHNATYVGETHKALKHRSYEHHLIDHKTSNISHSIQQDTPEAVALEADPGTRRSARISKKQQPNYKEMHTGSNLAWSEGNTVVSAHITGSEHGPHDVTIKAIGYDDNWHRRGFKEALEIRRRTPNLNLDKGRVTLPHIYGRIVGADSCAENTSTTEQSTEMHPDPSTLLVQKMTDRPMAVESSSTSN